MFDVNDVLIVNNLAKGISKKRIQSRLGIDDENMAARLKTLEEYGFKFDPRIKHNTIKYIHMRALELFKSGKSPKEIAKELNITPIYFKASMRKFESFGIPYSIESNKEKKQVANVEPEEEHQEPEELNVEINNTVEEPKEEHIIKANPETGELNILINSNDDIQKEFELIYSLLCKGYKQVEIARMIGKTRQEVSRKIKLMEEREIEIPKSTDDFITNETLQTIIDYIDEGKTNNEIAVLMNKTKKWVENQVRKLKKNDIAIKRKVGRRRDSKSIERDKKIIEYLDENKTTKEIAKLLGINPPSVYKRINQLKRDGYITDRTRERKDINKQILELYNNGIKPTDIAKEIGIRRTIVYGQIYWARKKNMINVKSNLSVALKGFIEEKNPTKEQLDVIIKHAAETYGVSEESVRIIARKVSAEVNGETPIFGIDDTLQTLIDYVREGKTNEEIDALMNKRKYWANDQLKLLRKNGIIIERKKHKKANRSASPESIAMDKEIIKYWNENRTQREIASLLSISPSQVQKTIKRLKDEGYITDQKEGRRKNNESAEKDRQIIQYFNEKKSPDEIALLLGINKKSVYKRMKKLKDSGIIHYERDTQKEDIKEEIIKYLEDNKTPNEIALLLGVSRQIVYNRMRELKDEGQIPDKGKARKELNKTIQELYDNGMTPTEIANKLGIDIIIVYTQVYTAKYKQQKKAKSNLSIALKGFIEEKNPTKEQLDEIVKHAAQTYGVDEETVRKIAQYIEVEDESPEL